MMDEQRRDEGVEEAIEDLEAPADAQGNVHGGMGGTCGDPSIECAGDTCHDTEAKCTQNSGKVVVREI